MERYSGTQARDAVPVDPVAEGAAPGGEMGLEDPMWQLGLGGGPESYPERPDEPDCMYYLRTGFCGFGNRCRFNHPGGPESYPERPDEPDCIYYLRTGFCGFGNWCRFNHPRDRSMAVGALRAGGCEYAERVGQPVCQYYMRTGICEFGASCKYHHPKHGVGSSAPVTLNVYGYPLRLGEKECSYYIMTGQCKFGVMCKFHHPQPAGLEVPAPAPARGPWPLAAQPTVGAGPVYGIMLLSPSATAYTGPYLSITSSAGLSSSSQKGRAFPERPGQPECLYYLRTGDCKFGATCKFHHPPDLGLTSSSSQKEHAFPKRPGQPECQYYLRTGDCKFGAACKYHHPPKLGFRRLRWRSRL